MAIALYIKKTPKALRPKVRNKKRERFFAIFIITVGVCSALYVALPYAIWQLKTVPKLTARIDEAPVPTGDVLSQTTTVENVEIVKDPDGFSYFSTNPTNPRTGEFVITIPQLDIEDAIVKIDSLKFDQNLSLFPGTALPGEIGNTFITGHSVLPQFADPGNYRAIFTKLGDLEIGDDIFIEMDGKKYHYIVQYSKVVDPRDISVLNPISDSGRNLTLMTCVPPGTNLKRLVVVTTLI